MTPPDMVTDREIAKWRRDGSNWKASRTNRLLADRERWLGLIKRVWDLRDSDTLADVMWDCGELLKEAHRE